MDAQTPVQYVKGVGPKLKKPFEKLGVLNVRDLIYLFPRSYEDRRRLPRISQLVPGEVQTVVGLIESIEEKKVKKKLSVIECTISDQSGTITATWFNQPFLKKVLRPYTQILIKGKVEKTLFHTRPQMNVLEMEVLKSAQDIKENVGCIVPIYPLTGGVYQYQIRSSIRQVLDTRIPFIKDNFPQNLQKKLGILPLKTALQCLHKPKTDSEYEQSRYRIVFEEFLYYQLALAQKRQQRNEKNDAPILEPNTPLYQKFLDQLPYTLTNAQKRAISDIEGDITKPSPMNRLIQGDVGSGKTDVAIAALLFALGSSKTGAMMAPTEILAEQHYIKLKSALEPLGIPVYLLKGKLKAKEKKETLQAIQEKPSIVVGTHALIEENVVFNQLGVMIVDEQHRFGVLQRLSLKKGQTPHCLFMTATPIPRTFMLTCFGDLDKSIIDEMPPGRVPQKTYFMNEHNISKVYEQCRLRLNNKEQMFVVYPLVEESEKMDLQSAMEGFETIKEQFSQFKVGLIHGRLKPDEKAEVMEAFKNKDIDILVATTVIEVGIDVPNATMMIINHAERFGLSQLHQLRGRIGRGGNESICFLVGEPKTDSAKKRIKAMVDTTDGFKIAEYDLMIRGPGDMLGTRQAGLPEFHLGDIVRDEKILLSARKVAQHILDDDPALIKQENRGLKLHIQSDTNPLLKETLN